MREVEYGGQNYEIRSMKRKEIKALRKSGFNLNILDPATADDCMDRVFAVVFDEGQLVQIDDLDQRDAMALFMDVLKETYGSGDEEKN